MQLASRCWFFPCGSWPAGDCSPAVMHVCRHASPAGWLLQRQAARPRRGLACSLWELACQRMFACGDARLQARFASRLAPTKTGRSWPHRWARAAKCRRSVPALNAHAHLGRRQGLRVRRACLFGCKVGQLVLGVVVKVDQQRHKQHRIQIGHQQITV